MATYNGKPYIEEQLDSIINQSYKNWILIIRDDNSKDNTIAKIKQYKDKRIRLIQGRSNLGQVRNFNALMELALNEDYIMFSDQDDVWDEHKIKNTLIKMHEEEKKHNYSKGILVYTKVNYVDQNLSYLNTNKSNPNPKNKSLGTLLCYNFIWGCTMMLNNMMIRNSYPVNAYAQNHDYWIALNASLKGEIVLLDEVTMLYRQHNNNVTGGLQNKGIINKIKRLKKIKRYYNQLHKQNYEFCSMNMYNKTARNYINYLRANKILKIYYIFKLGLRRSTFIESIYYYFISIFTKIWEG
jgi:rhamnosyltransferase